jgi:hypothetical protein
MWSLRYGDEVFVMTASPFTVGRTSDCRLRILDDQLISRKHASFTVVNGLLWVEDHESRNGVIVSGKRIAGRAELLNGDRVFIGNSELLVVHGRALGAPSASTAAPPPANAAPEATSPPSAPSVEDVLDGRYRVGRLVSPSAGPLSGVRTPAFPWLSLEAEHKLLGGEVTIKLLPGEVARLQRSFHAMLLHEGRVLRRAAHAGVQKIFDIGETDARGLYLVLERLPPRTLDQVIEAGGATPELTLHVLRELATVLQHLQAMGIVHGDLRNGVIHVGEGVRPEVRLGSFALATVAGQPALETPRPLLPRASPSWMAPERRRGQAGDARSDLYALGVVLATMLTGRLPEEPEPPVTGATGLEAICRKLLARDPSARYGSARELLEVLPRE